MGRHHATGSVCARGVRIYGRSHRDRREREGDKKDKVREREGMAKYLSHPVRLGSVFRLPLFLKNRHL